MSGLNVDGRELRKGAADSVRRWVEERGGAVSEEVDTIVAGIAVQGGTPLTVAEDRRVLGVIYLKDIVKEGMRQRFDELRKMGIRTVMITGDNPRTAEAIAAEAGVDDYLAEATPEDKMALIRQEQQGGKLVAMTGDGTNDAPALAQADVGVAMNTGTSAAKEAGNMVDLDSNPTKLIEIVAIGKQLLITRGALTTFSIANDVAKYFAIIPAMFVSVFPGLGDAEHHEAAQLAVGDPVRGDLQRDHHRDADPAGPPWREVPAAAGWGHAPEEPGDLRSGRRDRPVHRDQAGGSAGHGTEVGLMRRQLLAGLRMLLILTVVLGVIYPLAVTGIAQLTMSDRANGSLVRSDGHGGGIGAARAGVRRRRVVPAPTRLLRPDRERCVQPRARRTPI